MKTQIYRSKSEFSDRAEKMENGVSAAFAERNPNWESQNTTNIGCSDCSDCYDNKGSKYESLKIPVIENIHRRVLEAVSVEGVFDMDNWHSCGTAHCRGGWVITLAGEEGKRLENQTSSEFAAMAIYKASSIIKVYPVRFYESNEIAMADIVRCANEEAAQ
jgi:hypothetical protein